MEETEATQTQAAAPQPAPAPVEATTPTTKTTPMAAIAYFPVLFIITMMHKGKDEFHVWHAKMGASMTVLFVVITLLWQIFYMGIIGWLLYMTWLAAAVMGGASAFKGKKLKIPGLSQLATKIPLEKIFHEEKLTPAVAAAITKPTEVTPEPTPVAQSAPAAPAPEAPAPEPVVETPAPEVLTPAPVEATAPTPVAPEPIVETPAPEVVTSAPVAEPTPEPVAAPTVEPTPVAQPAPIVEPVVETPAATTPEIQIKPAEPEPTPVAQPAPVAPAPTVPETSENNQNL
jgi:hypothetical protein